MSVSVYPIGDDFKAAAEAAVNKAISTDLWPPLAVIVQPGVTELTSVSYRMGNDDCRVRVVVTTNKMWAPDGHFGLDRASRRDDGYDDHEMEEGDD